MSEKLDKFKSKLKEKQAAIMGMAGLADSHRDKFSSNGSLLSQNGIKFSSEPELTEKCRGGRLDPKSSNLPEVDGYISMKEGKINCKNKIIFYFQMILQMTMMLVSNALQLKQQDHSFVIQNQNRIFLVYVSFTELICCKQRCNNAWE